MAEPNAPTPCPPAALRDDQAVELIRSQLSGVEWTPDTLEEIARIVRLTGREIEEP